MGEWTSAETLLDPGRPGNDAERKEKKMKNIKKISALVLALVMVLALSATALAANVPQSGVIASTTDTSIVIKKEITAFNPSGSMVNAPSITYSYSIAPGSADKEITDEDDVHAATVAGPTGATITSSITWNAETVADQMNTASGGAANTKDITVDLSGVTFPAAGIYRYVITETANFTNTGVIDGGDHTRYLDVYVKNSETAGQYEIYGYVCFKHNNNIDGSADAAAADAVAKAVKTQGFVSDTDDQDELTTDKYYTYNLTVSKTLTGDAGMNSHQFPFGIAFSGSETGVLPIISGTAGTKPTWSAKGTMSSFSTTVSGATLKIANEQNVVITGIPVGTSVTINEKNDVTGTTYTSESTGLSSPDTNAASKSIETGATSNDATIAAQTAGSATDKTVSFENTLVLISPTGVVLRVAPYALILFAGVALLLVSRRRKEAEEA